MYLLVVGVILLVLKLMGIDPVASWSWITIAIPFGLAAAWWAWADWSGYTKRREMDKMEKKKAARIEKNREALGLGTKRRK